VIELSHGTYDINRLTNDKIINQIDNQDSETFKIFQTPPMSIGEHVIEVSILSDFQ
jgi:hypothetical protein